MPGPTRQFFDRTYERASGPEALPWHRDEPPELLQRAVAERGRPGRALDIGCGAGLHAAWLARQGYRVTGLDFSEPAIVMARRTLANAGVNVELVHGDVLAWSTTERFDLIFDSGCMHAFGGDDRLRYRDQLLGWLAEGGDYVLGHFDKRHALDWRPMGPRRLPASRVLPLFVPPLEERGREYVVHAVPFPIGPTVRVGLYWLRRPAGERAPS